MSRRRVILLVSVAVLVAAAVAAPLAVFVDSGDEDAAPALRPPTARSSALPGLSLVKSDGYFASTGNLRVGYKAEASPVDRGKVENVLDILRAQYAQRAYPLKEISFARAQEARASFEQLPLALPASASATGRVQRIPFTWKQLGAARYQGIPWSFGGNGARAYTASGRIMALLPSATCAPGNCRLWVGTAGGGVWGTNDALAGRPGWKSLSRGITSAAIGSLARDPTDVSGRTIYAGTGELGSGGDSEAGTGVFRSTNGGNTWELLRGSTLISKNRAVTGIVVDPRNPDRITISTAKSIHGASSVFGGEREPPGAPPVGIYRSEDGGDTVTRIYSQKSVSLGGTGSHDITQIELDPNDPDTLYAAVSGSGLWRVSPSLDGDTKFHQVFTAANLTPESGARLQFAVSDLGAKTRIYLGDSDPSVEYGEGYGIAALYRLDDAAVPASQLNRPDAWTQLSSATPTSPGFDSFRYCQEQCWYDNVVATPPGRPNDVWLGGMFSYDEAGARNSNGRAIVRSTDAGESFTDMTVDARTPPINLHPDVHAIAFASGRPDVAFFGTDGGLYRTSGQFVSRSGDCDSRGLDVAALKRCKRWLGAVPTRLDSLNQGLATLQFQSISTGPTAGVVLGGTQDNGTWEYSPAKGWRQTATGDGGQSGIGLRSPKVRYHTYYNASIEVNFRGFDTNSWAWIGVPLYASGEATSWYMPFIVDPRVPQSIFVGLEHVWRSQRNGGDRAFLEANCTGGRSTDGCGDWKPLGRPLTGFGFGQDRSGYFIAAVERAPSDRSTLWAATLPGRVFISRNADAAPGRVAFKRIDVRTRGKRRGSPGRFVSGIVIDPKNANHAWIGYSGYSAHTPRDMKGHVFEVTYNPAIGRAGWKNLSFNLGDEPVTDVTRDAKTGDLYAATDFGVVRLPRGARAWTEAAPGLPLAAVYGLTLSRDGRLLYAATHGRSVWTLRLR
jgi:hypothetical protein